MIAEGIHSLVDSGNSGLMIYGRRRSKRGPDPAHPFGHGMELYFWTQTIELEQEERIELAVDVPAPPDTYVAAVRAKYPD